MNKTQATGMVLVLCGLLASCAQQPRMLEVKRPSSVQLCGPEPECVVPVVMSLDNGRCVYDLADSVWLPRSVDRLRWDLQTEIGSKHEFRFPAARQPVLQKPGDKGPPFTGPVPGQREPSYTARRDAAKVVGLTYYKMSVEYRDAGGSGHFTPCVDLDPVIVNMP